MTLHDFLWPPHWEGSHVAEVATWLLRRYVEDVPAWDDAESDPKGSWDGFYTPYQFTLPLMQALYHEMTSGRHVGPVGLSSMEGSWHSGLVVHIIGKNPHPRRDVMRERLLAIAYYSWEPDRRHFLNRRVYPTYFDFLSISHIPQGWGVSAAMLRSLEVQLKNGRGLQNGLYTYVSPDDEIKHTLPYVAEKARLGYESVVVVPVFAPERIVNSEEDLLGCWLLFLRSPNDQIPSKELDVSVEFLRLFCDATARLVEVHREKLGHPGRLDTHWQEMRQRLGAAVGIARLELRAGANTDESVLKGVLGDLLRALSGPEFYAVRGSDDGGNDPTTQILYVASREDTASTFRERLLRLLIDEKCSHAGITVDVSIRDIPAHERLAFRLDTDHWESDQPV